MLAPIEIRTKGDFVDWMLRYRANFYEEFFTQPELALVLCQRRKSNRTALIKLARAGYARAHASLCGMARFLTDIGDPLPPWLQDYTVTAAKTPVRPKKRGRDPLTNLVRNAIIWQTVNFVARTFQIPPTRNPAGGQSSESACLFVSRALERQGIYISEAGVVAIWRQAKQDEKPYFKHRWREAMALLLTTKSFLIGIRDGKIDACGSPIIADHLADLRDAQHFWEIQSHHAFCVTARRGRT